MGKKRRKRRTKKLNFIKICLILLGIYLFLYSAYFLVNMPIKHIRVFNNKLASDQFYLEQAAIDDYPSFFLTTNNRIKKKLLKNKNIKDVKVKKSWSFRVDLYIDEYKILFYDRNEDKFILENKRKIEANKFINDVPILVNYVPNTIYDEFINKMLKIKNEVFIKISEIQYNPNDVDKERFTLSMNDGNTIYLTLYKFDKLNEYNNILPTLENKKGTLYLDSGNYFEIYR